MWEDIVSGRYDPKLIAGRAIPYSIDVQLPRLFERHRQIQDGTDMPLGNVVAQMQG